MAAAVCGCVYLPSEAGCELWSKWDPATIEADLARMRAHGLRAFRFFVLWRDFEPLPGEYEEQAFVHLRELAQVAQREQLQCLPAVLTIFMNGELLDLPWRAGRDLWSDPFMVQRARAFAARVATTLSDCASVMAYDIGDELVHIDLPACERLSPEAARGWQQTLADTIRAHHPGALVFQGSDASAIFGTHPFGLENSGALDLLGVHTFPNWPPVPVDGVRDPLSSLLPGFLVRFARAFGRPLVDELGVYGTTAELTAGHLKAAGASALAAGAEALFAWCWQDIVSSAAPYAARPHERLAGLLDAAGEAKPSLPALQALLGLSERLAAGGEPGSPIGVLIPERWAIPQSNYLDGSSAWACAALGAYVLLTQEKLPVQFLRAPEPHTRLLICPGFAALSIRDIELIEAHVEGGGHVWCTTWTPLALDPLADLLGGTPIDFTLRAAGREQLHGPDGVQALDWRALGIPASLPLWELHDAETHASFQDGTPAICSREHGDGRVWFGQLPLELQPFSAAPAVRAARWGGYYAAAARAAGIQAAAHCVDPWVEVRVSYESEQPRALVINHAAAAVSTRVQLSGYEQTPLELKGKDFKWLEDFVALDDCVSLTPERVGLDV